MAVIAHCIMRGQQFDLTMCISFVDIRISLKYHFLELHNQQLVTRNCGILVGKNSYLPSTI